MKHSELKQTSMAAKTMEFIASSKSSEAPCQLNSTPIALRRKMGTCLDSGKNSSS